MEVQLSEIMCLDSFENVQLVTGEKRISNRVDNVYVMEVPDIAPYIGENGLLLTTLYPIIKDDQAMKKFIPDLIQHKVAGVAIKLGRYINEIPNFMIEQARENDFPILLLPATANFSILTNDILTKLLGMKTKELEFRESVSNKLHALMLSGGDIKELTKYVSELVEMDIIVLSHQFKYIESSFLVDEEQIEMNEEELQINRGDLTRFNSDETVMTLKGKRYQKKSLLLQSIEAGGQSIGYILLIKREKKVISSLHVVIEQAIILLAFLLQNRQTLIQTERHYLDNFIRSIIHSQFNSQSELIRKAKVFKWDIHFPNIILLVNLKNNNKKGTLASYYNILDLGIISDTIVEVCGIPKEQCKAAIYDNQIICFVSVALVPNLYLKLEQASDIFMKRLSRFGNINVSISQKISSMTDIPKAYEEALLVQTIFKDIYKEADFVKRYEQLGLFTLFHSVEDKMVLRDYVNEKLGFILESDKKNEMELVATLECLIKNNFNMKKSSEDLFIHYNSLRYRITKLKELGIDVSNGENIAEFSVAIQILSYLGEAV